MIGIPRRFCFGLTVLYPCKFLSAVTYTLPVRGVVFLLSLFTLLTPSCYCSSGECWICGANSCIAFHIDKKLF